MFTLPYDWTNLLLFRKFFLPFHFQFCRLFNQYVMHCIDFQLADLNVLNELGVFLMGKIRDTLFVPKKRKPLKLALWCFRNLHGIVRNSGCLEVQ